MERSTQFMMTGYAYDDKNSTSNLVNIPGTESGPPRWSVRCGPSGRTRGWSSW
ncbi:hypothetical protein ACIXWV_23210 [Bacteroides fragilis]